MFCINRCLLQTSSPTCRHWTGSFIWKIDELSMKMNPRSAPFIMAHASGCALHRRCLLIILLLGAITNSYYWWKLDVEWMIQRLLLLLSIWFIDDKWNGNMNATHSATEKEKTLFIELITVWFSCSVGGKTKHHHHCTCTTIAVDSEWGEMKLLLVYWALDFHEWE